MREKESALLLHPGALLTGFTIAAMPMQVRAHYSTEAQAMTTLILIAILLPSTVVSIAVWNMRETCGFRGPAIVYPGMGLNAYVQKMIEDYLNKHMGQRDGAAITLVYPNIQNPRGYDTSSDLTTIMDNCRT
ncbi:hypothetical protein OSTOST_04027 [Ostertagia ostertagi]